MNMRLLTFIHQAARLARLRYCRTICFTSVIVAIFSPEICLAQTEAATEKKNEGAMIRMLCVQSLPGQEEEALLATKTEDESWIERGEITLRSHFITAWQRVPHGTTHIIRKDRDKTISFGSFSIAPDSKRSIILLFPDKAKNIYRTQVIDPGKLGFQKGKALILNYGKVPALVKMGDVAVTVKPGQQVVERIDANEDGMYRLLVGYLDENKNIVPCYDKFVSSNPKTRKFILLFPDQDSSLRAMSFSEFGPFE